MTQRTVVQSLAGATLAISANLPLTYDAAGYADTDLVFTEVGEIENYGNHGVVANITEFTPVDTAVVTKLKGSKNYGTMNLVIGHVPSDAGQVILATASESNLHYSAKITYPLGDGEVTPEIHYLDVMVASREFQDGSVNDVRKAAVALALCRRPVEVAAT